MIIAVRPEWSGSSMTVHDQAILIQAALPSHRGAPGTDSRRRDTA